MKPRCKFRKYLIVIPGVIQRRNEFGHMKQKGICGRTCDILSLIRCCRGKHDVGVLCSRRPPGFMNDHRLRLLPGLTQPIQILVVMERIAATPINQADIRVTALVSVKAVGLPRIEQHIGNTGNGYKIRHGIVPTRQGGAWESFERYTDTADRPVAIPYTATRQPDLAQHRSQGCCHPIRLLSMLGTLK